MRGVFYVTCFLGISKSREPALWNGKLSTYCDEDDHEDNDEDKEIDND